MKKKPDSLTLNEPVSIHFDKQQALSIDTEAIKKLVVSHDLSLDNFVLELLEKYTKRCATLISPEGGYFVPAGFSYDRKGSLLINQEVLNVKPMIAGQLKGSENILIFLCTIGEGIEKYAKQLYEEGKFLENYLVNLIGSEVVEQVADMLQEEIKLLAGQEGLKITNRFSPGYCNWDVKEQSVLFSFFPKNYLGIHLNESCLMTPVKSISGIIGIGHSAKYKPYKCDQCNDRTCTYRNLKDS